jgi:hypothetical protein
MNNAGTDGDHNTVTPAGDLRKRGRLEFLSFGGIHLNGRPNVQINPNDIDISWSVDRQTPSTRAKWTEVRLSGYPCLS